MVEAMAAGTLKMIAIIGFRFRSMKDVAIALATNLHEIRQEVEPRRYKDTTHATKK